MEKTIKLSENIIAVICYSHEVNITPSMVEAYLNRETGDKDNSTHNKCLSISCITFFTHKKEDTSGLYLDHSSANKLATTIIELEMEANKEHVTFDDFANSYYC